MHAIARFLSTILSPLLMPTYGVFFALWISILCYLPVGTRLIVLLVIFGITCILPMIFIAVLHSMGVIKDQRLINRKERLFPYIFIILCYVIAAFYLNSVHSPIWVIYFIIGGAIGALVAFIITFWWKISAHMAGIGGIVALMLRLHIDGLEAFDILWLICVAIIGAGLLGSARVLMERHTVMQVLAGFANGFIWVYIFN